MSSERKWLERRVPILVLNVQCTSKRKVLVAEGEGCAEKVLHPYIYTEHTLPLPSIDSALSSTKKPIKGKTESKRLLLRLDGLTQERDCWAERDGAARSSPDRWLAGYSKQGPSADSTKTRNRKRAILQGEQRNDSALMKLEKRPVSMLSSSCRAFWSKSQCSQARPTRLRTLRWHKRAGCSG